MIAATRPPPTTSDRVRTMCRHAHVRVRRVYDEPESDDGIRVLVDRIWPRGMTKTRASLHEWCKDVAPSTDLRRWYGHDPTKFAEFADRYRDELNEGDRRQALAHLHELAAAGEGLTLLTGTKNPEISEAAVLATVLTADKGRPDWECWPQSKARRLAARQEIPDGRC
jgi:uncharacterized protein YeaO (DUF488 family)